MSVNLLHQDALGRFIGGARRARTPARARRWRCPGTGGFGIPPVYPADRASAFSLFFSGIPRFPLSAMVSLLESNGLAKILAEPTLVALSGQEAKFLAGGEFPVPISTELRADVGQLEEVRHHPRTSPPRSSTRRPST